MTTMMWLSLDVDGEGMFPNERAVSFQASDGGSVSLFAPTDRVESGGKRLRVRVLDCDDNVGLVELPAQNLSGGSTVVRVSRKSLEK